MNIVFPLVLGSLIVIATVAMYQAYQGLFSSFIMFILTLFSVVIAWNYCEPLGWSLGEWHSNHLFFVLLFGGLVAIGGLAKAIMRTNRYVRLAVGIGAVVFLMVVGSSAKMPAGVATGSSYWQAVALVGLFALSLLCLRAIADNVVLGKVTFPWQVERVGGGILGFFSGMIMVGVVLISWQLMPFSPGLLAGGYQNFYGLAVVAEKKPPGVNDRLWARRRAKVSPNVSSPAEQSWASYNRYDEQMKLQAAPFPYVDGFTLGLVKALSHGSMSGEQEFGRVHQDLLLEAWANRNGIDFQSRQAAPGNAIVSAQWERSQEKSLEPGEDNKVRGVLSLALSVKAKDEKGTVIRFKGPQVRLVGTSGRSYWPMGIHLDNMPWSQLYGDLDGLTIPEGKGYLQYGKADYRLWAGDDEKEGIIRREIRGNHAKLLWWQVQLLGRSGELRLLPTSFGVVCKPEGKAKEVAIKLIYEIPETDTPDYVVFKRTAMRNVRIVETVEEDSPEPKSDAESEGTDR